MPLPRSAAGAPAYDMDAGSLRRLALHEVLAIDGFQVEISVRSEAAGGYSGTVTVARPMPGGLPGDPAVEVVFSNGLIVHKSRFPSIDAARSHALEVGCYAIEMFRGR